MKNNKNINKKFTLLDFLLVLRNSRMFSSSCKPDNNSNINSSVIAEVKYDDLDVDKVKFLADNRHKSGVYRLTNKKNGKTYIGSSINLTLRFYTYYSLGYLVKSNRPVDRALLAPKVWIFKFQFGNSRILR